jgi:hypothetical protein
MLQHEERFHDDVKLVLVYSLLTRSMLKVLQRSVIGKASHKTLTDAAFSWFSQIRQKELLFTDTLPAVKEFVMDNLPKKDELESDMLDSIAEMSLYIIMHAKDKNLHETITHVTNPSYRKCELRKAWQAGAGLMAFEDWYKDNHEQ